jgi:hypothetical protein
MQEQQIGVLMWENQEARVVILSWGNHIQFTLYDVHSEIKITVHIFINHVSCIWRCSSFWGECKATDIQREMYTYFPFYDSQEWQIWWETYLQILYKTFYVCWKISTLQRYKSKRLCFKTLMCWYRSLKQNMFCKKSMLALYLQFYNDLSPYRIVGHQITFRRTYFTWEVQMFISRKIRTNYT